MKKVKPLFIGKKRGTKTIRNEAVFCCSLQWGARGSSILALVQLWSSGAWACLQGGAARHMGGVQGAARASFGAWEACKGQGARGRALACACVYSRPKLTCSHYEIFIKIKTTLKILKFLHNILDIYMYVQ